MQMAGTESSTVMVLRTRLCSLAKACPEEAGLQPAMQLVQAALGESLDMQSLSDLYDVLEAAVKASLGNQDTKLCFISTAAALLYLQTQGVKVLQQFINSCFLPLMNTAILPSHAQYMQAGKQLCELLVTKQGWPLLQRLLDGCTAALTSLTDTSMKSLVQPPTRTSDDLPAVTFHACCCLVPSMLSTCAASPDGGAAQQLVAATVQQLLPLVVPLLRSEAAGVRKATLQALLPSLVMAAHTLGSTQSGAALQAVSSACFNMLTEAGAVRRAGLAALVQVAPLLRDRQQQQGSQENTALPLDGLEFQQLAASLGGPETLDRKRAVFLLQQLMAPAQLQHPTWQAWLSMYSLLEEFGMHLIKPAWHQINALHPPAPEYADAEPVPTHISGPRNKLRSRKGRKGTEAQEIDEPGHDTEPAPQAAPALKLAMPWLCILWQRGLQHTNVQVQRLAMRSFLQRSWCGLSESAPPGARAYTEVDISFVLEVFLPCLVDDFPYAGTSTFDCQVGACQWMSGWLASSPPAHQRRVIQGFLELMAGKGVPRTALHKAVHIWCGCMCAAHHQLQDGLQDTGAWAHSMLTCLDSLCMSITNHYGSAHKNQLYACVLSAAPWLAPVQLVGAAPAMHLLACVPPHALASAGELYGYARRYLFWQQPTDGVVQPGVIIADIKAAQPGPLAASALPSGSPSAAVKAVLDELLQPWREYEADWGSRRITHLDIKALSAYAASLTRLVAVTAHMPASDQPPATHITRLISELPALYERPYVPPVSLVKRLLLAHHLVQSTLTLMPQLPPNSPLLSPLLKTITDISPFLTSCGQHYLNTLFTKQQASSSPEGQEEPPLMAELCIKLASSTTALTARLATTHSDQASACTTQLDTLSQLMVAVVSTFIHNTNTHHLPDDAAFTERVLHLVKTALDALACVCAAAPQLLHTCSHVLSDANLLITSTMKVCSANSAHGNVWLSNEVKWALLDSVLSTCLAAHTAASSGRAQHRNPIISFHDTTSAQAADPKPGPTQARLSVFIPPSLSWEAAAQLLVQGADALGVITGLHLLPVLRCVRACWSAYLAQWDQPAAQVAMAAAFNLTPELTAVEVASSVCGSMLRALCSSMSGSGKRITQLCAAFTNTILLPQLFPCLNHAAGSGGAALAAALHGVEGPVPWAVKRIIDWGAASARITLLVAGQLTSLLLAYPVVGQLYTQQLQALVMFGTSRTDAGQLYEMEGQMEEVVQGQATDGQQQALELSSDSKALLDSVAGTEVAPRVALLCGLHQLALQAGVVWKPAPEDQDTSLATPTGNTQQLTAGSSSKPESLNQSIQQTEPAKRPVIMFHDAGDWEPVGTPAAAPPAACNPSTSTDAQQGTVGSSVQGGLAKLGSLSTLHDNPQKAQQLTNQPDAPKVVQGPLSKASQEAGLHLWQQLLNLALTDPKLSSDKMKFGSELHRRKLRLWQGITVLSSFVQGSDVISADVQRILSTFTMNEAPSVKQYQEATVAALLVKQPELVESLLLPLVSSYEKHHPGVGSYILISAQVVIHSSAVWRQRLLPPLLLAISPWLTCHTHNVRTFAQMIMFTLLTRYPPEYPVWSHAPSDLTYLRHFQSFCQANSDLQRLRRALGEPLLTWSVEGLTDPGRLLVKGVSMTGQEGGVAFEGSPATLLERITLFLTTERYRLREELSDRMADIEYLQYEIGSTATGPGGSKDVADASDGQQDFQRKVMSLDQAEAVAGGSKAAGGLEGLWHSLAHSGVLDLLQLAQEEQSGSVADSSKAGPAAEEGLRATTRSGKASRQELIIVASLVDKLPNLAGLARTCEVFRAAQLVVPDLRMTTDPTFSSISVTAEQWVPMVEVQESALLPWLEAKQAEGYVLLGLEQTADSVQLPEYVFPSRAVLVLGREKEGMPPQVLSLLDDTVEIPQLGLIRSLNVHVSGAIAMYEYTKQLLQRKAQ